MTTPHPGLPAALLATVLATTAAAADAPYLPSLAVEPPPPPSIWQGLHVGSEIFAIGHLGGKGAGGRGGGFGGDVFAGYDTVLPNRLVLGIQGSAGYAPSLFGGSALRGYDFATVDAKLGYDLGRLMPYFTGGVLLAKPNLGPALSPSTSEAVSALLGGPGTVEAAGRVGAGVAYAITPSLSVDVGVSVIKGPPALLP